MYKNTYRIYDNGYARNLPPNILYNNSNEKFQGAISLEKASNYIQF